MRVPGLAKLRRASAWATRRFSERALILLYHEVTERSPDPWSLAVSPEHFRQHVQVLREHAHPLSTGQLAEAFREGTIRQGSVAVTFDDGYVNNLLQARPALEAVEIPATVYVSSGYVGSSREYWWDEIEQLLLAPSDLPETLRLRIGATDRTWSTTVGSRLHLFYSVWRELQPLGDDERKELLGKLSDWSGVRPQLREAHRPVTSDELLLLDGSDFIEVGAHTVTHPLLPAQPREVQECEIRQGKIGIEETLGRSVQSFSYPFGMYTSETAAMVREVGFDHAMSCIEQPVWSGSNAFALPRVVAPDCDGDRFAKLLRRWFRL